MRITADIPNLADDELIRVVAEHLGWNGIEQDSYWLEDFSDTSEVHCLFGVAPASKFRRPIPDFAHDLNAIVGVVKEANLILVMNFQARRVIVTPSEFFPSSHYGYGNEETPEATIVARAYLEWVNSTE